MRSQSATRWWILFLFSVIAGALICLALFAFTGCSRLVYENPKTGETIRYSYLLQDKNWSVTLPDGTKVSLSTSADPAVELAKELSNMAGLVAKGVTTP